MGADFHNHAAQHEGFTADLIRDVATDLHEATSDVALLAAELRSGDAELGPAQEQRLGAHAGHLAACSDVLHDLLRRHGA